MQTKEIKVVLKTVKQFYQTTFMITFSLILYLYSPKIQWPLSVQCEVVDAVVTASLLIVHKNILRNAYLSYSKLKLLK